MDLKMNGKFLSELRKEQSLTQKQLAEVLGVSDKTISKWECGRGFPDVSMMSPLCEALHISINELVSGQKLSADDYLERAEENMKNLMQDNENKKKRTIKEIITSIAGILSVLLFFWYLPACTGSPDVVVSFFDMPGIAIMLFVLIFPLCFTGRFRDFRNAFRFIFKEAGSQMELRESIAAVAFAEKMLILGGAFSGMFYIILLFFKIEEIDGIEHFAMNMGIALLTVFYGLLGVVILAPLKNKLEKKEAQYEDVQ